MRAIVTVFALALLAGTGLAWLMERESGYLLIAVGNTTIEMNLWAGVLALILLWIVARLLWKLLCSLKFIARWRNKRLSKRRAQTARGLLYFIEGRWPRARQQLIRGARQSDMPLVNYLAAASAAFEEGDHDAAQTLLAKAEEMSGGNVQAVEISRAKLHIKAQRYEEALSILSKICRQSPQHAYALRLLEQTHRGLNDWQSLLQLLPQLRRHGGYSRKQFESLEISAYSQQLTALVERLAKGGKGSGTKSGGEKSKAQQIDELWASMPAALKRQAELVCVYSDYLQSSNNAERAEKLLHNTINNHWDDRLVRRYGLLVGGDINTQIVIAEAWLRERPNNPALLLALGRLAQRAELWGKARDYLESALALSSQPEIFAELARLMARLGETDKSVAYYQQGLVCSTALVE